jgi:hypothetical protein
MNWPKTIDVLIEGYDTESKATLIGYRPEYDSAEYENNDGKHFFIDRKYMHECLTQKKAAEIPLAVVTQLERMRNKLDWGHETLNRLEKEKASGLTLPNSPAHKPS